MNKEILEEIQTELQHVININFGIILISSNKIFDTSDCIVSLSTVLENKLELLQSSLTKISI